MPISCRRRGVDPVFGVRRNDHVFSDDSQETLKESSTSTYSKTRSIDDSSSGSDVEPLRKCRLRKPRGKIKVNYQEPPELDVHEIDRRHFRNATSRRPLQPRDNSPIFRITPDTVPAPATKQTRQPKPKPIHLVNTENNKNLETTKNARNTVNTENVNQPRHRQTRSSYNFSDFDDYSLIVSEGSGRAGLASSSSTHTAFNTSKLNDVNDDVIDDVFTSERAGTDDAVMTYGSTPARTETSTPQRTQTLEVSLEALSLSIIEGSPEGQRSRSSNVTKPDRRNTRLSYRASDQLNNSVFHTSLESIAESDHEHSHDLFNSPDSSPRQTRTRNRSYDAISAVSRLASVLEDGENEENVSKNQRCSVVNDEWSDKERCSVGNDEWSDKERCSVGNDEWSDKERCSVGNDEWSDKENEETDGQTDSRLSCRNNNGEQYTSHSTPLRDERQASYVHYGSTRKSCLPQLEQLARSLMILTPVKLPGTLRIISPRRKLLHQCDQPDFLSFSQCFTRMQLSSSKKIGEGVYGEVFSLLSVNKQPLAVKIIPIAGDKLVNEEQQKSFEEILPEIVISKELSSLRHNDVNRTDNFVHLHRTTCVRGSYPDKLLTEWNKYNDRKGSENDSPEMFDEEQLFIILEFSNGGQDLETYQFTSVNQALSVLNQTTIALAVAEKEFMFEHRDLHLGNILIGKTKQKTVSYMLDGEEICLASHGVKICLIDFTLSRLTKDECTVYLDLSKDETLFQGQGDPQFDVYRKMRENNGNFWEMFEPVTNVYWLAFLADKLSKFKYNKKAPKLLRELRHFHRNLADYGSAYDVVTNEFQ